MGAFTRVATWFRSVGSRGQFEQEMEDELRFHVEARAEDLKNEGMSTCEAYRQARLELGDVETHKHGMRHSFGLRWLDDLIIDLSYALRVLRRSPGFTAIAIGSLALAIGANTAIFSFANEMIYERLAVPQPRQLRLLVVHNPRHGVINSTWGTNTGSKDGTSATDSLLYPIYTALKHDNNVLQELFAFKRLGSVNITVNGTALSATADLVSGNYYQQLQVKPALGRAILPSDDTESSGTNVLTISDGLWTRAFARDPNVLGKVVVVNMIPFTVVGVNPPSFTGTRSVQTSPDLFMPLSVIGQIKGDTGHGTSYFDSTELWWVEAMARTKEGVSKEQAEAALNVTFKSAVLSIVKPRKDLRMPTLTLDDGSRGLRFVGNKYEQPMYVLLAMTGFVLLLACANLANLVLARAATRQREMGVRLALGASRSRLLRQVLTENILLASVGGAIGLAAGYFGSTQMPRLTMNVWDPAQIRVPFHWPIFAFTATITILTGVFCGVAPAIAATRTSVTPALRDGSNTSTRRSRGLTGRLLVAFQIAVSTLLVAGAALFLRSLWQLNHMDIGFQAQNLLLFELNAPASKYPDPKNVALHQRIEETLRSIPGVLSITVTDVPMLADNSSTSGLEIEGRPVHKHNDGYPHPEDSAMYAHVGEGYLSSLGIPLLRGRTFSAQDSATSQRVALVTPAFVQRFFPQEDAIGKRFRMGSEEHWTEIIGIAGDVRYAHPRDTPPPLHFDLYRQHSDISNMTYMIRTAGSPFDIVPSLRQAIARVDHDLPMRDVRTQQQQIDDSLQEEHVFAALTSGFGLLALILACVGIYGMMAYRVAQRTQEIGLRLALGAQRSQVRGMVLSEAGWIAVTGITSGVIAVLLLARLVSSMLYGLKPSDPLSLCGAAFVLLTVALLSAWIPAMRAARMQPLDALRHE